MRTDWQAKNTRWAQSKGLVHTKESAVKHPGKWGPPEEGTPTKKGEDFLNSICKPIKWFTKYGVPLYEGAEKVDKLQYQCGIAYFAGIQSITDKVRRALANHIGWDKVPLYYRDQTERPKVKIEPGDTVDAIYIRVMSDFYRMLQLSFNPNSKWNNAAMVLLSVNEGISALDLKLLKQFDFRPITNWEFNENSGNHIRVFALYTYKHGRNRPKVDKNGKVHR